ncbi:MAG: multicopper oxidase domain-containing protein [Pelotomaculum sp.]|uniref:Putative multicopper oxidases n=1 Tax=Pelotomaculum thermopropionicum (strain DSM 13744 / JCM 10971 / SI) TaxID=370438 RepID=A5D0P0_PELTS|nr:multicopper oxidase domain-containing protein [Pelotomaculum sp.]BAF60179.1 putative multicopper oxidases [Pelotomaculum thermopropionicum SI]
MPKRYFWSLFATDGFINLPTDPTGTAPREKVYVFGFVGGLFKTQPIDVMGRPTGPVKTVNPQFDPAIPENLDKLRGTAVIPAPRIDLEVGDELYLTLTNLGFFLTEPPILDVHTIHIHGAHIATQLDGVPETSFGLPVTPPGMPGITITYYFKPERPGTYFYHCHQEASEHIQMGMYGALIVYPSMESLARAGIRKDPKTGEWFFHGVRQVQIPRTATNRNFAYDDINTFFNSDWVLLFSDIDSAWHRAVFEQADFNPVNYKPDWWLVNGRAFPDTLLPVSLPEDLVPGFGYSIPAGYETYVRVSTGAGGIKPPDKFLLRMSNLGYQPVPFHVHGWHGLIIGKDTDPRVADMKNPAHQMNFTTLVGSGESYDVLYTADDKRDLYADYIFCGKAGFPSLKQQIEEATARSIAAGTFIPPFPGATDLWAAIILETGLKQGNFIPPYNWAAWNYGSGEADGFFFPQFYLAHNHDDYKVTNNGVYPGGQLIFIETDYPGSNYKATPPIVKERPHVCPKKPIP